MENHLNLPPVQLQTRLEDGIVKVYDALRRKYVALTPEEFVRQHFTSYLIKHLGYPPDLIANEVKVDLNGMHKRCDTLVYTPDNGGKPLMIIEYKAPSVEITQETFNQIVRYNMILKARYLVVSNGLRHYCCAMNYSDSSYNFLPQVPAYANR